MRRIEIVFYNKYEDEKIDEFLANIEREKQRKEEEKILGFTRTFTKKMHELHKINVLDMETMIPIFSDLLKELRKEQDNDN